MLRFIMPDIFLLGTNGSIQNGVMNQVLDLKGRELVSIPTQENNLLLVILPKSNLKNRVV